jgi:hypothetical protein
MGPCQAFHHGLGQSAFDQVFPGSPSFTRPVAIRRLSARGPPLGLEIIYFYQAFLGNLQSHHARDALETAAIWIAKPGGSLPKHCPHPHDRRMHPTELPMTADEIIVRLSHLARTATSASLQLRALAMLMHCFGMLTPAKTPRTPAPTAAVDMHAPGPVAAPVAHAAPAPTNPLQQPPTRQPATQLASTTGRQAPPTSASRERVPAIQSVSLMALARRSEKQPTAETDCPVPGWCSALPGKADCLGRAACLDLGKIAIGGPVFR